MGALIIEAALVFPIFLTILFSIVDLGYAEFQTSQATAAARDGARSAILNYTNADVSGSSDNVAVTNQVTARLAGQQVGSITVACLSGITGSTTEACSSATPDTDRIRVTVSWTYGALSPIMSAVGPTTISGTATMAIVGLPTGVPTTTTTTTTSTTTTTVPGTTTTSTTSTSTTTTTTTPPGGCIVTGLTANPAFPIQSKNNGDLVNSTTFTVTTNGAGTCTGLQIQFPVTGSPNPAPLTFGGGSTWTITVSKNAYSWTKGANQPLNILSSSGTTLQGGAFTVTVS